MNIGTAKPDAAELQRVQHHFIDIADPDQQYSAGRFGREARQLIEERGQAIPILVGGSGLYLQAVLDGFFEDDTDYANIRRKLQNRLVEEGASSLYSELSRVDPVTHARLEANDVQRILRALEVAIKSRQGLSELRENKREAPLHCIPLAFCLNRDREQLYRRIDERVDQMVEAGFLDEVRFLVKRGYDRNTWAMRTFGYEEMLRFIAGECRWDEAIKSIKRRSRQYAKRQLTWFRRDRRMRWLNFDEWGEEGVLDRMISQVNAYEES